MTAAMLLATALLLAGMGDGAPGTAPIRYETAPDSLRAIWQGWLTGRDSVHVTHLQTLSRPVPFSTRLPCRFEVSMQHEDTRLAGDAARRLVSVLGAELALPDAGPRDSDGCPPDTAGDSDVIAFEFTGEGRSMRLEFHPRRGSLNATDAEHYRWWRRTGPRAASLLATLGDVLPDDLRLAELVPCVDTARAEPPARAVPRAGEFVYVEQLPALEAPVTPKYPDKAIDQGLEGEVVVRALVGKDGHVWQTRLFRPSSGNWLLEESAVAAVEKYRFKPALSNGQPVAVWVAIPVRYRLDN